MTSQPFNDLDIEAARRALDYYLNPAPATSNPADEPLFIARQDLTAEAATQHASGLLRCAAASAYESADNLKGGQRDVAFSVMHMINLARAMLDRSLAEQAKRQELPSQEV